MSLEWVSSCRVVLSGVEPYGWMFVGKGIVYPHVAEEGLDILLEKCFDHLEVEA